MITNDNITIIVPSQRFPMNFGNPGEVSMMELAQTIRALVGSRSEIVLRPLPVDDPRRDAPRSSTLGGVRTCR